jgi:hypothetical protein
MTPHVTPAMLARAHRAFADALEDAARDAEIDRGTWLDQAGSPLGSRRHCAAVRRRVAQGLDGAAIVGRRHLLSPAALAETMRAPKPKKSQQPSDPVARARERLRLIGGSL